MSATLMFRYLILLSLCLLSISPCWALLESSSESELLLPFTTVSPNAPDITLQRDTELLGLGLHSAFRANEGGVQGDLKLQLG